MSADENPLQLGVAALVAILMGYFLLQFLNVFPSINGTFGRAYLIFSLMPWLLFILGIVLFLSMLSEVANL